MWKDIIESLYKRGKLSADRLENAVDKKLITEEEKAELMGE